MTRPDPDPNASKETGTSEESGESEKSEDVPEDPAERARRTVRAFEWSCAWLALIAGGFVLSGMAQTDKNFNVLAWLGAIAVVVCVLALVALYVGCARDKVTLRTRAVGPFDLFQASTVVVVVAVICGLAVPTDNRAALSLLLPWALTYWIYGMDREKPPTDAGPTA